MQRITLPFSDWTPDIAPIDVGGIYDVLNVYPRAASYSPWRSMVAFSDAIDSTCLGALAARDTDGNTYFFAGTTTKLYLLGNSDAQWDDVSRSGSAYAVPSLEYWGFAQFGDNVIAVNGGDAPQKYVIGTSTEFEALAGSPPTGSHIGIVRDFVVIGNLSTGRNKIQWSGFNNSESWTIGTAQSDSQEFPDGGSVQGIVGGEVGYIIQEQSIRRMTYVGGDVVFLFDEIERDRGTQAPKSIVRYGNGFFYYGRDGFYFFNGAQSQPIGSEKIDAWFAGNADQAFLRNVIGAYDPIKRLVIWSFISTESSTSVHDGLLIYSPSSNKWTPVDQGAEYLVQLTSPGYTLETLDTVGTNIDAFTVTLDSPLWAGGALSLAGFNSLHKACGFSGPTLEATITTKERQIYEGRFGFINAVLPIIDTEDATASVGSRSRFADSISYTTPSAMQVNGICPVRARGRSAFVKIQVPAGSEWTHGEGAAIECREDGRR